MENTNSGDNKFYLYLMLGLLFMSIFAGTTLLFIAIKNPPNLINDNYYDAGKMINKTFEMENYAENHNLHFDVYFVNAENTTCNSGNNKMTFVLLNSNEQADDISNINLSLTSLVSKEYNINDIELLKVTNLDNYAALAQIQQDIPNVFYLNITGTHKDANFRINRRIDSLNYDDVLVSIKTSLLAEEHQQLIQSINEKCIFSNN